MQEQLFCFCFYRGTPIVTLRSLHRDHPTGVCWCLALPCLPWEGGGGKFELADKVCICYCVKLVYILLFQFKNSKHDIWTTSILHFTKQSRMTSMTSENTQSINFILQQNDGTQALDFQRLKHDVVFLCVSWQGHVYI